MFMRVMLQHRHVQVLVSDICLANIVDRCKDVMPSLGWDCVQVKRLSK